jgi:hypothetical protein
LIRWRRSGKHRNTPLAELLTPDRLHVAYPDEYLQSVGHRLSEVNLAHLPVVSRSDGTLVGYLGWKDFLRVQTRLPEEERNRTTFFPRRQKSGASERVPLPR